MHAIETGRTERVIMYNISCLLLTCYQIDMILDAAVSEETLSQMPQLQQDHNNRSAILLADIITEIRLKKKIKKER